MPDLNEFKHQDFLGLDLNKDIVRPDAAIAKNVNLHKTGLISKRAGYRRVNQRNYGSLVTLIDCQRICDYGHLLAIGDLGKGLPLTIYGHLPDSEDPGHADPYTPFFDPYSAPVILNAWAEPGSVKFFVVAYDPCNLPLSYHWDFGGGDTSDEQNPVRSIPSGLFNATVTVRNSASKVSSANVVNTGPTADLQITPLTGAPPLTVTYDCSGSSDPEGDPLTYDIDWGDGTPHSDTPTGQHIYTTGGTFDPVLTITDQFGATDTDTKQVVTNPWVLDGILADGDNPKEFVMHNSELYLLCGNGKLYKRTGLNTWVLIATSPYNVGLIGITGPRIYSMFGNLYVLGHVNNTMYLMTLSGGSFVTQKTWTWINGGGYGSRLISFDDSYLYILEGYTGYDYFAAAILGYDGSWTTGSSCWVGVGYQSHVASEFILSGRSVNRYGSFYRQGTGNPSLKWQADGGSPPSGLPMGLLGTNVYAPTGAKSIKVRTSFSAAWNTISYSGLFKDSSRCHGFLGLIWIAGYGNGVSQILKYDLSAVVEDAQIAGGNNVVFGNDGSELFIGVGGFSSPYFGRVYRRP